MKTPTLMRRPADAHGERKRREISPETQAAIDANRAYRAEQDRKRMMSLRRGIPPSETRPRRRRE